MMLMKVWKIGFMKRRLGLKVIVNSLRKLESAGIIESKSLGMKGTYIKVLKGYFLELIFSNEF